MCRSNFWKKTIKSYFSLTFLLLMTFAAIPQTAQADAYINIDVKSMYLYNGQLQMQTVISNLGDRNAVITGVYFDKINVTTTNGDNLWNGWARFSDMSVYVSAGNSINHTFNVNNNSVRYYGGATRWNYHCTAYWDRY